MREGGGDRRCSVDIFVAVCCEPGVWVLTLGMLWPRAWCLQRCPLSVESLCARGLLYGMIWNGTH